MGLSVKEDQDAVGTLVLKPDIQWRTRTNPGAFDSPQVQSSYNLPILARALPLKVSVVNFCFIVAGHCFKGGMSQILA